jgi:divalent metal cation (Fe/Co/Zn/Cd) transporter
MSATTQTPPVGGRIWYGIFAAPVAFGIQEMLDWLISSGACPSGAPADVGGLPLFTHTRAILWAIGAGAFVASLAALWVGIDAWRQTHDPSFLSIRAHGRTDYLAAAAMLVSAVFLIAILWQVIAVFVLPQCEMMR